MGEPLDDPLDRLRDLLRRDPVDPKPKPKPETEGEVGRFAGLLRLSLAVNLFHRAVVLAYGPTAAVSAGGRSTAFGRHRRAHPRAFWACFWIDIGVRLLVLLVALGLASLVIWAAVTGRR